MARTKSINTFPVVLPYSLTGKVVVVVLKAIYIFIGFFKAKKWQAPPLNFEENPAYYKSDDIMFLGYKYYIQPPQIFEHNQAEYFKNQDLNFPLPYGFEAQSSITISVGGDLMPYARINEHNTKHLWEDVGDWFFGSDIVFANLETPIDVSRKPSSVPEIMVYNMLFNGGESLFNIFSGNGKYKGYDVVSTANNHSLDMGEKGVEKTIEFLEKHNVAFCGTARTSAESKIFPILERNGIKIAFIAYTYSLNHLELENGKEFLVNHIRLNTENPDVSAIKIDVENAHHRGAELVVLSLHTGNAYQVYPSNHTINNYHKIFNECGVDIILGSHPHNPQPMEKYVFTCPITKQQKNGFAIYSLADFVAYDIFVWDRLVPLLKLTVTKGFLNGKLHTQLSKVTLKPVYNWGSKTTNEIRFFDLKKLIVSGFPNYFTKKCNAEATYLNEHCDTFLVTEKQKHTLAS